LISQGFEFAGDYSKIPQPIYVPTGFSITKDLRKLGLKVDDNASKDILNIKKLLRIKRGSVVAITPLAKKYIKENSLESTLMI
jgi:hypothetical protein